ncbi:DUF2536 family protein [Bacillus alkalicellulosilyticus]|uniref:DUF2536 family protein n=1 Tax=Alkalihalobacterium alkalicellulosilyticum TaxID=1912214 RepID=UPI000998790E|nr:DUF2536 family protein [Bacillus alkalicellulosilyticus]
MIKYMFDSVGFFMAEDISTLEKKINDDFRVKELGAKIKDVKVNTPLDENGNIYFFIATVVFEMEK